MIAYLVDANGQDHIINMNRVKHITAEPAESSKSDVVISIFWSDNYSDPTKIRLDADEYLSFVRKVAEVFI